MPIALWLETVLPAFLVALGWAGLLRRNKRAKLSVRLAEAAPVLGFLAGFAVAVQGLPFFGNVAQHRVGETAVLAFLAALGLALLPPGPRLTRYLAFGAALLAVFWMVPAAIMTERDFAIAALAGTASVLVLDRLASLLPSGPAALLILVVATIGLAAIAVEAHAVLIGVLALALAGSGAGWLVWTRPWAKTALSPAAIIGAGMVFAALGTALAQSAPRPPWALLLLLAAFWAETIRARLPPLAGRSRRKSSRPSALAVAAALPVLAAAALGLLLA
jgi:hypothetical protein